MSCLTVRVRPANLILPSVRRGASFIPAWLWVLWYKNTYCAKESGRHAILRAECSVCVSNSQCKSSFVTHSNISFVFSLVSIVITRERVFTGFITIFCFSQRRRQTVTYFLSNPGFDFRPRRTSLHMVFAWDLLRAIKLNFLGIGP